MADWLIAIAVLAALTATLLPLLPGNAWWIRGFEFPRVQLAVLTLVVLTVHSFVSDWWARPLDRVAAVALALCIVFQLFRIFPYTILHRKQMLSATNPADDDCLSLIVSNVLMTNRNAAALLGQIAEHRPDLVLAVETDEWWQAQLDTLGEDYLYTVKHPLRNLYGMHLYSRLPLIDPQVRFLVEDDVPSIHAGVELRSGHRVDLHCLHPAPPSPTENPTSAERDAELLVVARRLDPQQRSVVIMGDLNDVAWSATTRLFQRVSGLLDPRIGRGMYNTFHAKLPFLRWPLDHVFCSNDFTLVHLERLRPIGSDHFPMRAVFCHTAKAMPLQDAPDADSDDETEARQRIDDVETAVDPRSRT